MRRLLGLVLTVLLLACWAAPAVAQEEDAKPERLAGGDALKWRRPARAWPLLELDRYDREVLGVHHDRPELLREIDFDLLWPFFGYHDRAWRSRWADEDSNFGYFYALPVWVNTWSNRTRTYSLLPLGTWWDRGPKQGLTLYPALFDLDVWEGGLELDFPWPFARFEFRADRWNTRVWPVWWAGSDHDSWHWTVAPLFGAWQQRRRPDGTYAETGLITPLGGGVADRNGHYAMVTPLYHQWRDRDAFAKLLLPLFFHYTDDRTNALVTPLASFVNHRQDLYWSITPLYHHWRDAKHTEGVDILFPLFWNFFDEYEQITLALPLGFWLREGGTAVNAIGPFWSAHEANGSSAGGVFPVVWYADERDRSAFWLWPLFGWTQRSDAVTKGGRPPSWTRRSLDLAWPLIQVNVDHDGDWDVWAGWPSVWFGARGSEKWFNVAPALYADVNASGVHVDVAPALIAPLGKWVHSSDDFYLGIGWPFGLSVSTSPRRTQWWIGAGALSWWSNQEGDWSVRVAYEGFAMQREDDRFEWRLLYRFMRYRSTTDTFLFEFNPFFRYESEGADWHFSLFMGAYQVWTHGDELKHQLFWSIEW